MLQRVNRCLVSSGSALEIERLKIPRDPEEAHEGLVIWPRRRASSRGYTRAETVPTRVNDINTSTYIHRRTQKGKRRRLRCGVLLINRSKTRRVSNWPNSEISGNRFHHAAPTSPRRRYVSTMRTACFVVFRRTFGSFSAKAAGSVGRPIDRICMQIASGPSSPAKWNRYPVSFSIFECLHSIVDTLERKLLGSCTQISSEASIWKIFLHRENSVQVSRNPFSPFIRPQ